MTRKIREAIAVALEAQSRFKLRTSLSVLGVVLGVAAVIAMMSVTDGARREALAQVQLLGIDNLVVRNRAMTLDESRVGGSRGLSAGDAAMLASAVPTASAVSPLIERNVPVARGGREVMVDVVGVRPSYQSMLALRAARGRLLGALDEHGTRVCVLGAALARRLFGFADPLDQSVRLVGEYYRVVGVLEDIGGDSAPPDAAAPSTGLRASAPGALSWRDLNDAMITPLPALTGRSLDVVPGQHVDEIWLRASDGDRVESTGQVLRRALRSLHGGAEDFEIVIPRQLLAQRYQTQRTFGIVIGSVAALALIIGGIGIMNIMLTSVVERTHEIGIRRTVGATRRDIAVQFLIEAVLMTVGGGIVGIAVGGVLSWGISTYAAWATYVSPSAVLLAFVVSISVGLGFGIYPATRAARLEPIDAVRYE